MKQLRLETNIQNIVVTVVCSDFGFIVFHVCMCVMGGGKYYFS